MEEESYDWIETGTKRRKKVIQSKIKSGKVIKKMYEEYRHQRKI
jgi:hypothetical protein